MSETLQVSEVFLSIQGEGTRAGRPCTLIRLAGCDLRCRWCDTAYAWEGGEAMTIEEIVDRVRQLGCRLVEVTGGEPLIQPATPALLARLCEDGWEVLLETSGTRDITVAAEPVVRIVDVKCPGSGVSERNLWANLEHLRRGDEVKFVLVDRADYLFARDVIERHDLPGRCSVLMGAVAGRLGPAELAAWILADKLPVRLNVQLHKVLWPERERGV